MYCDWLVHSIIYLHIILAYETLTHPILTFEDIKFFLEKFKDGDVNDPEYRTALVDIFLDKIYIFDGDEPRAEIYCNASDQKIKCAISEPVSGSSMAHLAPQVGLEPTTLRLTAACSTS